MRPLPEHVGWRAIAPVDTIGYPTLSAGYINDIIELAGPVPAGTTLKATFTKVDGLWQLIPETLSITSYHTLQFRSRRTPNEPRIRARRRRP
jgi:hypothetical protein